MRHEHRIRPRFQGRGRTDIDLQYDALTEAGVTKEAIYEDRASGKKDDRPGLAACLEALR